MAAAGASGILLSTGGFTQDALTFASGKPNLSLLGPNEILDLFRGSATGLNHTLPL
jgi:hypothetical protein